MNIHQLKITLKRIRPPVWRRVQVPADITLGKLHDVIQIAMGWFDGHMHEFWIGNERYGEPDPEFPNGASSERNIRLDKVAGEGGRFIYTYDFGDNWEHEILIEKVLPAETGARYPRCLAGKRACPPEDCGGPPGYQHLLEILGDPKHPEHEEMLEWLSEEFDPEYFDLEEINAELRRMR